MISKLQIKTFLFLTFGIFLYLLMIDMSIIIQALIFVLCCFYVMYIYQDKGILHPLSWFPMLFFFYSVSYPLYLNIYTNEVSQNIVNIIPLCFIGFLSFIFGFVLLASKKINYNYIDFSAEDGSLRVLGWFLIIICNTLNTIVFFSGSTSKREYLNFVENSGIGFLFTSFFLLALISSLVLTNKLQRSHRIRLDYFQTSTLLTFLISFGLTGERDLLFRYILLASFIFFTFYLKYKSWKLNFGIFLFLLILPMTQQMKAFFVSSQPSDVVYESGDYLNSEFASAGRNILYLLDRNITDFGWSIFLNDIYRFFSFLGTQSLSATAWFNEIIRNQYGDGGTSGWGFSMVGEGYAAFGTLGVIMLFSFLGFVTSLMYNYSSKKFIFCLYLLYVPVMIYVIRADLSNFLSLNFKVNLFMVMLLFIMLFFMKSMKKRGSV